MTLPTPRSTVTPMEMPRAAIVDERDVASARATALTTPWGGVDAAVASARGVRHAINEDCHSPLDGTAPVFIVADGVGGGALASRASQELVSRMHSALDGARADAARIRAALLDADRAVRCSIATRTDGAGAATVALCAARPGLSRWLIAWVGDCRIYRVRAVDGAAQLLTTDDTYRHLQEEPPAGGSLDDPARMVGNGAVDAPNVRHVALGDGDMLVLCSDGVHKHTDIHDIERLLRAPEPLDRRCMRIVEFARSHGSHDDATVLVVHRAARRGSHRRRAVASTLLAMIVATSVFWLATRDTAAQDAPAVLPSTPSSLQSGVQP